MNIATPLTLRNRLMPQGLPGPVAGTTLRHWANMPEILTKITLKTTINGGDNAALRVGTAIFKPGAGAVIQEAEARLILNHSDAAGKTAVGVFGLGSTLASGAAGTLASDTTQDIDASTATLAMDGVAAAVSVSRNVAVSVTANGVFLNIADTWPDVTTVAVAVTGTIWLRWRHPSFN